MIETLTRAEAKETGTNFYFTNKECKHGHVAKRRTSNGECTTCIKVYQQGKGKKGKRESTMRWRANNPDMVKAQKLREYKNNKDRYVTKAAEWAENNRESSRKSKNKWAKNNLGYGAMKRRERYATQIQASSDWSDRQYIKDVYNNAQEMMSIWKGIGIDLKLHVDHIVPLKNDKVCGLHNEYNLQVLTEAENCSKNNKFKVE